MEFKNFVEEKSPMRKQRAENEANTPAHQQQIEIVPFSPTINLSRLNFREWLAREIDGKEFDLPVRFGFFVVVTINNPRWPGSKV